MMEQDEAAFLMLRAKMEAQKAVDAMRRGDNPIIISKHRELAMMYYGRAKQARAKPALSPPSSGAAGSLPSALVKGNVRFLRSDGE